MTSTSSLPGTKTAGIVAVKVLREKLRTDKSGAVTVRSLPAEVRWEVAITEPK